MPELREVFLSTDATKEAVRYEVASGRARKIGPRLYTTNMRDPVERIVRRNIWEIVGLYCPGALIVDRTALENRPASDGSIFVVSDRTRDIVLDGLKIRSRKGAAPIPQDRAFMGTLFLSSRGRAILENLRPSRSRGDVSRTLKRHELEALLEKELVRAGEDSLNRLRDEARSVAKQLGLEREMTTLDGMIGALLGTRDDIKMRAPGAISRISRRPYDPRRLELFEALRVELVSTAFPYLKSTPLTHGGQDNLAFFEAYFSNFIEGTEFEVDEAVDIVFKHVIPTERPEDAHDILGTFRLTSNQESMRQVPSSFEAFLEILKRRHTTIMERRPEINPGSFKQRRNRAGGTIFVEPELLEGTLARGFEIYRTLDGPFQRALFLMFIVAEVHPFTDGNGRVARIMMNAELEVSQRIIIPVVYRNNYIASLKALSNDGHATALVRTMDFGQKYTMRIPWNSFAAARYVMTKTNAFMRPTEAEEVGIRLQIPGDHLLEEAFAKFSPS